ncbi:unnamed protein product [Linum trigynum]|uniref:Uncharacterized protein n=1 Tax=Linum trigynum TaxID=586398 RepID=A0AAV2DDG4_9ROSI
MERNTGFVSCGVREEEEEKKQKSPFNACAQQRDAIPCAHYSGAFSALSLKSMVKSPSPSSRSSPKSNLSQIYIPSQSPSTPLIDLILDLIQQESVNPIVASLDFVQEDIRKLELASVVGKRVRGGEEGEIGG